jgi:hypothetical protein
MVVRSWPAFDVHGSPFIVHGLVRRSLSEGGSLVIMHFSLVSGHSSSPDSLRRETKVLMILPLVLLLLALGIEAGFTDHTRDVFRNFTALIFVGLFKRAYIICSVLCLARSILLILRSERRLGWKCFGLSILYLLGWWVMMIPAYSGSREGYLWMRILGC